MTNKKEIKISDDADTLEHGEEAACEFYRQQGLVIMDDEDAHKRDLRLSALETMEFFKRGFRLLVQYKGNQSLALHAFCLAHGWFDLIECESAVEVAEKLFGDPKKKAAVTKAVKLFQDSLGIPPMPGQRKQDGREQMKKARKEQLKK